MGLDTILLPRAPRQGKTIRIGAPRKKTPTAAAKRKSTAIIGGEREVVNVVNESSAIETHVTSLRQKLEENPRHPL